MTPHADAAHNGAARLHNPPHGSSRRSTIVLTGIFVWIACLAHTLPRASAAEFRPLDPDAEAKIEHFEKFVAVDAFKLGNRIGGRTLSAIGLNFTQHFLGVVEEDVPATCLRGWSLLYTTGDRSLIQALGGEGQAAVSFLAYIYRLMEMGEGGAGHTDWRSNFAYVRSPIDRRLWAVHWTVNYADEWNIGAVYVPHPDLDWRSGSRLFTDGREPQEVLVRGSHTRAER
jgi:hypothetical protein